MAEVQGFDTVNAVRLEVQDVWPGLANLVDNPSGRGGASGWARYYVPDVLDGPRFRITRTGTSILAVSYDVPIQAPSPGQFVRAWARKRGGSTGVGLRVKYVNFLTEGKAIGVFTPGSPTVTVDGDVAAMPAAEIPLYARWLRLWVEGTPAAMGQFVEFDQAAMVIGTAAEVAAAEHTPEREWIDITGPTIDLNIDRTELDIGRLVATIRDSTLDPARHDLVRPGRAVRVLTDDEILFSGKALTASVTYDLKDPRVDDFKRTKIALTATDSLTGLANTKRPEGVATIAELPYILDGTGVPYVVNGSSAAIDAEDVTVVSVNENATAVDQVALTRDSALGYAWLDREGVVQAWDRNTIAATVAADYTEADYTDLDIDFDTARCINSVTIKVQSVDPVTGESAETTHGPYVDLDSVRTWGAMSAEFTVHGLEDSDLEAHAAAILAANATPQVRINGITIPLATATDVAAHATRDLYDLVTVSNERAAITQTSRVVSVAHRITSRLWQLQLGFAAQGGVAPPQVIPSPGTTGGLTQAQRLRPVGEVTMFYGASGDVPAGWLVCDGAEFDPDAYPRLADLLGGTTLPNLVDRFPIGAGVKALGTSGGNPTKTLTHVNLPNAALRGSTADGSSATTFRTGGTYNTAVQPIVDAAATPLDVMPPWRAVYFIIRAV